ncbi:MAG: hypothetical protein MPW15_01625 [Candidatus Manganitrophus sp.]|nr:hypothetical protein [Candidatus Manganitrophus sp.]
MVSILRAAIRCSSASFTASSGSASASFIAAEVLPPWLECASSMISAKRSPAVFGADLVQDERELLHRGDDDLLALVDEPPQVAGVLGVPDGRAHLRELLDRSPGSAGRGCAGR